MIYGMAGPGEIRAVAVQDGQIVDVAIERPGRPDGVGDVHRGRITAHVAALAGSFVALAEGEGFLPDSRAPPGVSQGQAVSVRIVRAAQGGKGPRLDARGLVEAQPGPPTLIERGAGAIARLAALHPRVAIHVDHPGLVAQMRALVGERLVQADAPGAIVDQLDALGDGVAFLTGGMRASFVPTPALVAIDLDTAAATTDRRGKATAQHGLNAAVLPDLARHIRARNLSGAIVVDLAGMSVRRRAALGPAIAAALAADPLGARFLGFTALGFAEILRPRVHPPLHELLAGPHAAGLAGLRQLVREQRAAPAAQLGLRAAPDVVDALAQDAIARENLAHATGRALMVQRDASLPPGRWTIEETRRA